MKKSRSRSLQLIPVMFCFFAMGFVDLVGIATNYVKADFHLSDTLANIFPSMVFFWFLICSVPTGMLMNQIGRRKTVLFSLFVTILALALPMIDYNLMMMLVSFSLLGIGNALMQVSLNPLIANIVSGDKLASTLTLGQFVKAIASFSAPLIAGWAAFHFGNWIYLYPIFVVAAIIALILLGITKIKEEDTSNAPSTFGQCFALLKDKLILLSFIGIMCHVGIDVGTNVTAPKLLIERLGLTLADAGIATSIYFLFRTVGCLGGSFFLAKFSAKSLFTASLTLMGLAVFGLFFVQSLIALYICIGAIGLANSNVFSIIFSQALLHLPEKKNEVSGLMIMGLFGGTVFPLAMGIASDVLASQIGAVLVMSIAVIYLIYFISKIKKEEVA